MGKIRVYLDNCAYNRPFDDQTLIKIALETEAIRYIQRLIVGKVIDMSYSYVNRFENDKNPHPANKRIIGEFLKTHFCILIIAIHIVLRNELLL